MEAEQASDSVLARKLAAGRKGGYGPGRSIMRALRLAVARTAAEEVGVPMAMIGATQTHCTVDSLPDNVPGDRMCILLDGAGDRIGGLTMDAALTSAIVQQMTTGQVSDRVDTGHVFTATDAALAAAMIDGILARGAALAEAPEDRDCLDGMRCRGRVEDARALILALEADGFRAIEMTIDVGGGLRQGRIGLILPDPKQEAPRDDAATRPGPGLDQGFGVMRAKLTAVICRLHVPLSHLATMAPGEVLALPQGDLSGTELVALNGHTVATGKLGQSGGVRAVRLRRPGQRETDEAPDIAPQFGPIDPGGPGRVSTRSDPVGSGKAQSGHMSGSDSDARQEDEDAYEAHLQQLDPNQAEAEISQLAGLPVPDLSEPEQGGNTALIRPEEGP